MSKTKEPEYVWNPCEACIGEKWQRVPEEIFEEVVDD